MAGKTRYLIERGGRFHARIVVAKRLQAIVGKTELSSPLGPDRKLALKALARAVSAIQDRLAAAEIQLALPTTTAHPRPPQPVLSTIAAASAHFAASVAFDSEARDADPLYASGFIDDSYVEDLRRVSSGAAGTDEIFNTLGRILNLSRERGSPDHDAGSIKWRALARRLAQAELASLDVTVRRDQGHQDPALPTFSDPVVSLPCPAVLPLSVRNVFDGYRKDLQKSGKGHDAEKRWSPVVEDLLAFIKHNDAGRITRHDAIRWKDHLMETLAAKTVRDSYLATARSAFSWALDNLLVDPNPFLGIKVRLVKRVLSRPKGFNDEEALAILKVAKAYLAPSPKELDQTAAAKRWTPFLAAYTGARIGELTQLRAEDIQTNGKIVFIRITPEAGTVKSGQFRDVPMHQHLIDLKFLDYVKKIGRGPLFYRTRISVAGRSPAGVVSGKVGKWIRSLNIADERVQPNHGWRHRLKSVGTEIGIDRVVLDSIQGHAPRSAGDAYGEVSLKAKHQAIARFPTYRLD